MKLWRVETCRYGAYVIAETPDRAIKTFEDWLNNNSYGYSKFRKVIKIEKIAESANYPRLEEGDLDMLLAEEDIPKMDFARMVK